MCAVICEWASTLRRWGREVYFGQGIGECTEERGVCLAMEHLCGHLSDLPFAPFSNRDTQDDVVNGLGFGSCPSHGLGRSGLESLLSHGNSVWL